MLRLMKRPEMKRILVLFCAIVVAVEAIVVVVYWRFAPDRVQFEAWISLAITLAVGVPALAYVVLQHVRLSVLNDKLAILSSTDQMTGLLNRQSFIDRLDDCLERHGLEGSAGVLAYMDADHFKMLNDLFGHAFGDTVIEMLAKHIRQAARPGDLCARLGGEEFGIFLNGADHDESASIAEALRKSVEREGRQFGVPEARISVSIGLALHRPGVNAIELMREADRSLYAAKHGGRNSVVIELKRYRAA